jgi:hypothetical protein
VVAQYRCQHDDMIGLADQILEVAGTGDSARANDLIRLRLTFSRAVIEHVEQESVMVREAVARGLIPGAVVDDFANLVTHWRADVANCNSAWPTRKIFEDPRGFDRCFRPLVNALREAAAQEDIQILSVIEKGAQRLAA